MTRIALQLVAAAILGAAGWSVGKAQTHVAEFEVTIDAPRGTVILQCHRGCNWGRVAADHDSHTGKMIPSLAGPNRTLFACGAERCVGTVDGRGRSNTPDR